jgi:hypothetical protein
MPADPTPRPDERAVAHLLTDEFAFTNRALAVMREVYRQYGEPQDKDSVWVVALIGSMCDVLAPEDEKAEVRRLEREGRASRYAGKSA